jgi:hypothetical protein
VLEVALPGALVGLGAGDDHLVVVHLDGEDAMALREGPRHDLGDGGDVDLERVDLDHGLTAAFAQPGEQGGHVQGRAVTGRVGQFLLGEKHQGMDGTGRQGAEATTLGAVDAPVGGQRLEQFVEGQPALDLELGIGLKHAAPA